MRRRRRRRNPESYWLAFGLVASGIIAALYIGKKLAGAPPAPLERARLS